MHIPHGLIPSAKPIKIETKNRLASFASTSPIKGILNTLLGSIHSSLIKSPNTILLTTSTCCLLE